MLTALARRSARLPAAGQVRVEIGGTEVALHLHDLGLGGVAITAPRPFWKGMTHRFTVETRDGASVTLVAKVVHCTPSPDGVTFITGCCMLLTREAIGAVGTFDDSYFAYCEDADLSLRLTRAGFALLHEPRPIARRARTRRRFVRRQFSALWRAAVFFGFYPTRLAHLARYVARGDRARAAAILRGAFA